MKTETIKKELIALLALNNMTLNDIKENGADEIKDILLASGAHISDAMYIFMQDIEKDTVES